MQWARYSVVARAAIVGVPVLVVLVVLAVSPRAGATLAVLFVGVAAATVVFAWNRTARHNAAVDRGDVVVAPDPHFRPVGREEVPADLLARLARLGYPAAELGRFVRFDAGWIVRQRNPRDVAVVIGDDGEWARFDPRVVTDLWAATEYRAGRGHESVT
jgi:hypothetical protein